MITRSLISIFFVAVVFLCAQGELWAKPRCTRNQSNVEEYLIYNVAQTYKGKLFRFKSCLKKYKKKFNPRSEFLKILQDKIINKKAVEKLEVYFGVFSKEDVKSDFFPIHNTLRQSCFTFCYGDEHSSKNLMKHFIGNGYGVNEADMNDVRPFDIFLDRAVLGAQYEYEFESERKNVFRVWNVYYRLLKRRGLDLLLEARGENDFIFKILSGIDSQASTYGSHKSKEYYISVLNDYLSDEYLSANREKIIERRFTNFSQTSRFNNLDSFYSEYPVLINFVYSKKIDLPLVDNTINPGDTIFHQAVNNKHFELVSNLCANYPTFLLKEDHQGDTPAQLGLNSYEQVITDKIWGTIKEKKIASI